MNSKYYTFIPGSAFLGQVLNVGVHVFFLISGYLYGNKRTSYNRKWMIGRLQRVYIPVVIVALIDLSLMVLLCGMTFEKTTVAAYLLNLQGLLFVQWKYFGKWITEIENLGHLWFTTIIVLCYFLLPLFQKLNERIKQTTNAGRTIFAVLLMGYGLCLAVQAKTGCSLYFFCVFFNGYVLANYGVLEKLNTQKIVLWGGIAVTSQLLRLILRSQIDGTALYSTYVSVDHVLLALGIVVLFFGMGKYYPELVRRIAGKNVFVILDRDSFYIYLVHGLYCFGVWNVYLLPYNIGIQSLIFAVLTICTAKVLACITMWLNARINKILF